MRKMAKESRWGIEEEGSWDKECSIAFTTADQQWISWRCKDGKKTDHCKLKSLCVRKKKKRKKKEKKNKESFITHSTGLYLISQEELIRNEKWKKDTISLQEILYMTLEHMQTNTLDILNKVATSETGR